MPARRRCTAITWCWRKVVPLPDGGDHCLIGSRAHASAHARRRGFWPASTPPRRTPRSQRSRPRCGSAPRRSSAPTSAIWWPVARRHRRGAARSPAPRRRANRGNRTSGRSGRPAARSGGGGDRRPPPPKRPGRAQGARPAGRDRGRLRGTSERHDRRRGTVPEVGQRDRAARLLQRRALKRRAVLDRCRGRRRRGTARRAASA